jgi:hypothetical protein
MRIRLNNFFAFFLTGAILMFSFAGIVWHSDTHNAPCLNMYMAMSDCSNGGAAGMEMVNHHLGFFLGVMQATDGIALILTVLIVSACLITVRAVFFFVQQCLLSRSRMYFLRSAFLDDGFAHGLREYTSWFSAVHASLLGTVNMADYLLGDPYLSVSRKQL